ncbi:hypothetical protein Tco_1150355 [Tanacetum coccineum]
MAYDNVIRKKAYNILILCSGDQVLREIIKETNAAEIWKKLETLYMTLANRLYLKKKLYTFHMHLGKSQSEHIDKFYKLDTLKLEDVLATLNSRVHIVRGQSHREKAANSGVIYVSQSEEHLKRDYPRYNHKKSQGFVRNEDQVSGSGADGYDSPDVIMAMSVEELLDWIMDSEGSYHITYRRDYLVNFKEYNGNNILLGDGREFRV